MFLFPRGRNAPYAFDSDSACDSVATVNQAYTTELQETRGELASYADALWVTSPKSVCVGG